MVSTAKVGTSEFADAVFARLGEAPNTLRVVNYPSHAKPIIVEVPPRPLAHKELVGMDVFIDWRKSVEALAEMLEANAGPNPKLVMT